MLAVLVIQTNEKTTLQVRRKQRQDTSSGTEAVSQWDIYLRSVNRREQDLSGGAADLDAVRLTASVEREQLHPGLE